MKSHRVNCGAKQWDVIEAQRSQDAVVLYGFER